MTRQEIKTQYHKILVADVKGIRVLQSGSGASREQGAINVSNLRIHIHDYSQLSMYSLLFVPNPSKILVAGLGAGIIPREMSFYRPSTEIDVVEIDPDIVDIAYNYFFYKDNKCGNPKIRTHIDNIWNFIGNGEVKYDIIVLDAFMEHYIPHYLMSIDFLAKVKNRLSDNGIIVSNLANCHPSYPRQINTYRSVFGDTMFHLDGIRNDATTILFSGNIKTEPNIDIDLPPEYYPKIRPYRLELTSEIKSSKIFTISAV